MILNSIENLKPSVLADLVKRFGDAKSILAQGRDTLQTLVGATTAAKVAQWEKHFDLSKELQDCKRLEVSWLDWNDAHYPQALRNIAEPPPVLYYQGLLDPRDAFSLGIVGSRQASRYGIDAAGFLARDLSQRGFTIVSGLARGIDTAAHQGALSSGGRTIAVMGSGFANTYPRENVPLMRQIAQTGMVLSEFPLSRAPWPRNFPRRNRIISGLSLGVVVVEAAQQSGSLLTASHALEQGKSVFAVPGRLDSSSSRGANHLIQQGAKLVASAEDIVEDLQYLLPVDLRLPPSPSKKSVATRPEEGPLPQDQRIIMEALEEAPTQFEQIVKQTQLPASQVISSLLMLEMRGLVMQYPGKQFAKKTHLAEV
jgi:DNA processing protein